jgi:hypothetical protein
MRSTTGVLTEFSGIVQEKGFTVGCSPSQSWAVWNPLSMARAQSLCQSSWTCWREPGDRREVKRGASAVRTQLSLTRFCYTPAAHPALRDHDRAPVLPGYGPVGAAAAPARRRTGGAARQAADRDRIAVVARQPLSAGADASCVTNHVLHYETTIRRQLDRAIGDTLEYGRG